MSVQSEINRIKSNIEDAYDALASKGATMPQTQNSENLAQTAQSINLESEHKYITKSLPASSWSKQSNDVYMQTFTDPRIPASYKLDIGMSSEELLQIMNDGVMSIRADNNEGTVEVICLGSQPSTDLNAQISFVKIVKA